MAENPDAAAEPAGAVGKKKPGKGKFILILAPLVVVMMGAGGWVAYTQYPRLHNAETKIKAHEEEAKEEKAAEESEEGHAETEYGVFVEIPDLIINPTGTDGQRFLLVSIGLEAQEEEVLKEIETRDIVIRDAVNNLLALQPIPRLSDIREREAIKEELRQRLNTLLGKDKIKRLYFTQYVLQ